MRYIDADALYKKIFPFDLVDPKLYTMHAKAVANAIDNAPTADVAPKSEVERLQAEVDRLLELVGTIPPDRVEFVSRTEINAIKENLAREIFEEIEEIAIEHEMFGRIVLMIGQGTLAELKKKYTEGREWTETNI